jgi:TRAP-type C4-dicarboxylate transport system permease small subunit
MHPTKIVAIVLVVLGALGLAYGGFTYTRGTHTADIGALRVSVPDKEYVYVPAWVGLGTLLVGVLLLAVPRKA